MRKLLVLGGIVSLAGIAAYGIRRWRRMRAADELQAQEEAVLVVISDLEPEIVVIAEEVPSYPAR